MPGRGFSFCGQHSDSFGLIWTELPADIYAVDSNIEYKSETISGAAGAIPHGYNIKPREFRMVCGFEDLTEGQRSRIGVWLRAGRYGRLIMDHRPYCYYNVLVTSGVEWGEAFPRPDANRGMYRLSGYLEFTFTAFVPYAYLKEGMTLEAAAKAGMLPGILDGTALLPESCRPGVEGAHAYLHNAGTARAKLNIILMGVPGAEGVTILNHTTGQRLHIAGDGQARLYRINAVYGRVEEVRGDEASLASHVHSGDYIELAPGFPTERNVPYHLIGNQAILEGYTARADDAGRYFYHGKWSRITVADGPRLTLDGEGAIGSGTGQITQLNDIEVIRGEDASLEITFDYKHTFY